MKDKFILCYPKLSFDLLLCIYMYLCTVGETKTTFFVVYGRTQCGEKKKEKNIYIKSKKFTVPCGRGESNHC